MGPAMEPHVRGLLDVMFSAGLSPTLVEALEQITKRLGFSMNFLLCLYSRRGFILCNIDFYFSIPSVLPIIQDRLLDSISMVLSKSHYPQGRPAAGVGRGNLMNVPQHVSDLSGSALVQLALQTLARFNFKVCCMLAYICQMRIPVTS